MGMVTKGLAPNFNAIDKDIAKIGSSPFNYSRVHVTQADMGKLIPIDIIECGVDEHNKISVDLVALSRNPILRRLQNGMTMYLHAYFCYKRWLWDGYENHMTKGRDGDIEKDYPRYYPAMKVGTQTNRGVQTTDYTTLTPYSPADYMGAPIVAISSVKKTDGWEVRPGIKQFLPTQIDLDDKSNVVNNNVVTCQNNDIKYGLNALPLAMYPKIKRKFYMNQNLVSKNKYWFPDNEKEFIIPYNAGENTDGYINCLDGSCDISYDMDLVDDSSGYYVPSGTGVAKNKKVRLNCLYSRPFYDDYFTTANPFKNLMRGENIDIDAEVNFDDVFARQFYEESEGFLGISNNGTLVNGHFVQGTSTIKPHVVNDYKENMVNAFNKAKVSGISLQSLKKALVMEKLLQRSAKTSGSYKEWIHSNWGYNPNIEEQDPIYIGGTYCPILTSEVVGTSGDEFGQNVSRASASQTGYICDFHNEDAGYIMLILSIMPDTYYDVQGLDPMWTRSRQDEEYIPILNNLEPNEIKNEELFVSDDAEWNKKPFGWKGRFDELRSRRNIVTGLGACGNKALFDSCTFMKRRYSNKNEVALSEEWLEATNENLDRTPFTNANEMPFDIICGVSVDKVAHMPAKHEPLDMGVMY